MTDAEKLKRRRCTRLEAVVPYIVALVSVSLSIAAIVISSRGTEKSTAPYANAIQVLQRDIADLQDLMKEAKNAVDTVNSKLTSLQHHQLSQEITIKVDDLQDKVSRNLSNASQRITRLAQQVEGFESEMRSFRNEKETTSNKISKIENDIAVLQQSSTSTITRVDQISVAITTNQDEFSQEIVQVKKQLSELVEKHDQDYDSIESKMVEQRAILTQKIQTVVSTNQDVTQLTQQFEDLDTKVQALQDEDHTIKTDLEVAKADITGLRHLLSVSRPRNAGSGKIPSYSWLIITAVGWLFCRG